MFDFGEKIDGDTAQMWREIKELKEIIGRLSSGSVKKQAAGRGHNYQGRKAKYGQRLACFHCGGPHLIRHCQKHWEDQSSRRNKESHSFEWVPEEKNVIGAVAQGTQLRKCWGCGETGHMKRSCIRQVCWGCGETGHMKRNCIKQVCWSCGKHGHMKSNCVKRVCWSCGETGHLRRNCDKDEERGGEMTEVGINERNIVAGVEEEKVRKGVIDDNNEVPERRNVEDYVGVVDDNNEVPECRRVEDYEGVVDDNKEEPEGRKVEDNQIGGESDWMRDWWRKRGL